MTKADQYPHKADQDSVDGPGATTGAWEDTGGGNPERRRLESLIAEYEGQLEDIRTKLGHDPAQKTDAGHDIYASLVLVGHLGKEKLGSPIWEHNIDLKQWAGRELGEMTPDQPYQREMADRVRSSLRKYRNYRQVAHGDPLIQFVHDNPSQLWQAAANEVETARRQADEIIGIVMPASYHVEAANGDTGDPVNDYLQLVEDTFGSCLTSASPKGGRAARAKFNDQIAKNRSRRAA